MEEMQFDAEPNINERDEDDTVGITGGGSRYREFSDSLPDMQRLIEGGEGVGGKASHAKTRWANSRSRVGTLTCNPYRSPTRQLFWCVKCWTESELFSRI